MNSRVYHSHAPGLYKRTAARYPLGMKNIFYVDRFLYVMAID